MADPKANLGPGAPLLQPPYGVSAAPAGPFAGAYAGYNVGLYAGHNVAQVPVYGSFVGSSASAPSAPPAVSSTTVRAHFAADADAYKPSEHGEPLTEPESGAKRIRRGVTTVDTSFVRTSPEYAGIAVTGNACTQLCNDLAHFRQHYQRASRSGAQLLEGVASDEERAHLQKVTGQQQLGHVVVSMMVWRRSVMKILVTFMMCTTVLSAIMSAIEWKRALADHSAPKGTITFAEWQDRKFHVNQTESEDALDFLHYTSQVVADLQRALMSQAVVVNAIGGSLRVAVAVIAFSVCWSAVATWGRFRTSRRLLTYAWCLSVAVPFAVSLIPARLWLDWGACEGILSIYKSELAEYIRPEERLRQLEQACELLHKDGAEHMKEATMRFEQLCRGVDKLPAGQVTVPTTWKPWQWTSVDFAPAHKACADGRSFISAGKVVQALETAQNTCDAVKKLLAEHIDDYASTETPQILDYIGSKVKYAAGAGAGLWLALKGCGALFPAALSIAPGLLQGAIDMKQIVPQSNVPGMMVLLLPWLYCPLTWCMYMFCFQALGNICMMLGLLVLAFRPVLYFFVGRAHNLDTPMSDKQAADAIQSLNKALDRAWYLGLLFVVAFLAIFLYGFAARQHFWGLAQKLGIKEDTAKATWGDRAEAEAIANFFEDTDWRALLNSNFLYILVLILKMYQDYFLTSAAGVDWMTGQMIEFREVETMRAEKACKREHDEILEEYNRRMHQLVMLDEDPYGIQHAF